MSIQKRLRNKIILSAVLTVALSLVLGAIFCALCFLMDIHLTTQVYIIWAVQFVVTFFGGLVVSRVYVNSDINRFARMDKLAFRRHIDDLEQVYKEWK